MLGALLHDIGKFVQRSQENPRSKNHSQWGEEWFMEHLAEKMSPALSESDKQIVVASIGNHHGHEKYISLADGISAGMDRVELEDEEKGDPFTDRLISVFSNVSLSDKQKMVRYTHLTPWAGNASKRHSLWVKRSVHSGNTLTYLKGLSGI
jgi:CRISPR-associated protein Csm1